MAHNAHIAATRDHAVKAVRITSDMRDGLREWTSDAIVRRVNAQHARWSFVKRACDRALVA